MLIIIITMHNKNHNNNNSHQINRSILSHQHVAFADNINSFYMKNKLCFAEEKKLYNFLQSIEEGMLVLLASYDEPASK